MAIGFKFRCYPTSEQQLVLWQWMGCQRMIYNCKVAEDRYFRSFQRHSLALAGHYAPVDQTYSQFKDKTLTPWLYEVPSQLLRNGAVKWMQAYSRFFKQLGGRPTFKSKSGKQSVWLTHELFSFQPQIDSLTGKISHYDLTVGTTKCLMGLIKLKAHRTFAIPKTITVSVEGNQWFVSFCNEEESDHYQPTEAEISAELSQWPETELLQASVGIDRGVVIPFCESNGTTTDFLPQQKAKMLKQERYRKRWQRKLARRVKGSSGWHKAKKRVAQSYVYAKNVRHDLAHQLSYRLTHQPNVRLIVFEDLKIKNMTKAPLPKPDQDKAGAYLPNGASAKAGLNKAILNVGWGQVLLFTQYKALKNNKLCMTVPPFYSSQECSKCEHVHPDNRVSQSLFVCQACGLTLNADINAGRVIQKRGVQQVLSQTVKEKTGKATMRLKSVKNKTVRVECSELPSQEENAHGEEHSNQALPERKEVFSLK